MSKPGPLCDSCPLRSAPGPVWGEGPPSTKLVIIGQNPGPDEIEAGRPFIGGSGTILNMAIQKAGGSRNRSFVTNVCKCYVKPGQPVPQKAIECCRPLLQQEMKLLPQASTILTLGAESFAAITGKRLLVRHNRKGAEKDHAAWLRGCVYQKDQTVLIPTIHPAFVMRTGFAAIFEFEIDVKRACEFALGLRFLPKEILYDDPTDNDVTDYCDELIAKGEGGIDLEWPEVAEGDEEEPDLRTGASFHQVGLSHTIGESISVRPHQFSLLEPLMETPREKPVILWAHNGMAADFPRLRSFFSLEGIQPADSMLAFYMLWSHFTNIDIATASSVMIDMPYYKNWRKLQPELYGTLGNCRDTYGCLWIGQACMKEMVAKPIDMRPLFWDVMMQLGPLIENWNKVGIRVDTDIADRMALQLLTQLAQLEKFWQETIPNTEWSSPKQLIKLFTSLNMPLVLKERVRADKSRHKTPSVDDDALEIYITNHNSQIAKLVQLMRGLRKGAQLATSHKNGFLYPKLKLTDQVGGRIQSSGTPDVESDRVTGHVQNIPEELPMFPAIRPRTMIVGDTKDCVVICADFSQIEFREYVWYANAKNLKAILDSGDYIYGILYEQLFSEPFFKPGGRSKRDKLENIPPWKLLLAKTYPMGFIYGRQPKDKLGAKLYHDFHSANPEISAFHSRLFLQVTRDRFYQSVFGRMRRFANPKAAKNEIYSCPGQVTAVDILNKNALLPLKSAFQTLECEGVQPRIMFPQYDSVEISVHKKQAEEVAHITKTCMEQPIPEMDNLVIPAEVHIGVSWDQK